MWKLRVSINQNVESPASDRAVLEEETPQPAIPGWAEEEEEPS